MLKKLREGNIVYLSDSTIQIIKNIIDDTYHNDNIARDGYNHIYLSPVNENISCLFCNSIISKPQMRIGEYYNYIDRKNMKKIMINMLYKYRNRYLYVSSYHMSPEKIEAA